MNDRGQLLENEASWSAVAGTPIVEVTTIYGGGNSKVFRLVCRDGRILAGKQYFQHPSDDRDRMQAELAALELLEAQGVASVPRIVAKNRDTRTAVYEFIEGRRIEHPGQQDIDQAVDFLGLLQNIALKINPADLQPASEAFFSCNDVIENIKTRLARLAAAPLHIPFRMELDEFIHADLGPALEFFIGKCRELYDQEKIGHDSKIAQAERSLSPSDLGFHNALRRRDGSICFLDFEYFGWDDPVKTLCDFIIHPHQSMSLDNKHIKYFIENFMQTMNLSPQFTIRSRAFYPLYRLKWCMIMLNEFIPADQARRQFSGAQPEDKARKLQTQLDKAKKLFKETEEGYEEFCRIMA